MIATFAHLVSVASVLPADASALERAISALVREITRLDSRSEFWEKSLPWFTALVVAGLLADVIVIIWERRDERRARQRWVEQGFHPAEMSSAWKFALELVATAAIFVGVALELWAGAAVAAINGQLRSKNSELRQKSNQLVVLLEQDTEDEHSARVAAEESVAWRTLSPRARSQLTSTLRNFRVERAWLSYNVGDTEAFTFGRELGTVLQSANWHPTDPETMLKMFEGPVPFGTNKLPLGIVVAGTIGSPSEKAAKALVQELINTGFDATELPPVPLGISPIQAVGVDSMRAASSPAGNIPTVFVNIESRPEGPQGDAKLRQEAMKKKQAQSSSP